MVTWNPQQIDVVASKILSCLPAVRLSLPLSSSLPASLSDESVMTPDAENAVVSPILPFLYLGNERDAQDLDLLRHLNVGYVVNVTTHLPLYHVNAGLRYKRLPATDNSKQNLRQYFEEVFEFIGKILHLPVDDYGGKTKVTGGGQICHTSAAVSTRNKRFPSQRTRRTL